jgi:hypothetical protein
MRRREPSRAWARGVSSAPSQFGSFERRRGLAPPTAQLGWLGRRLSGSAQRAEPAGSKSSAPPATRKARVEDLNRRFVDAHRHDLHFPQ